MDVDAEVAKSLRAFVAEKRRQWAVANFASGRSGDDLARMDPAAYRKTARYKALMAIGDGGSKTTIDEATEADKLAMFARNLVGER